MNIKNGNKPFLWTLELMEQYAIKNEEGCWMWPQVCKRSGYGIISINSTPTAPHRVAWRLKHGSSPPKGLHLDHLCRNRPCCNPSHLEMVTPAENLRRGLLGPVLRTHCYKGHPYAGNTAIQNGRHRVCKTCRQARERARYHRHRDKHLEAVKAYYRANSKEINAKKWARTKAKKAAQGS